MDLLDNCRVRNAFTCLQNVRSHNIFMGKAISAAGRPGLTYDNIYCLVGSLNLWLP